MSEKTALFLKSARVLKYKSPHCRGTASSVEWETTYVIQRVVQAGTLCRFRAFGEGFSAYGARSPGVPNAFAIRVYLQLMAEPLPKTPPSEVTAASPQRDKRVDILRGFALITIFVDHIPRNSLSNFTLHNFGFSDAAEIFVLLAGYSSTIAYGRIFDRMGIAPAVRRIAARCFRIYVYQMMLVVASVLIVKSWTALTGLVPRFGVAPLLGLGPLRGIIYSLLLNALPNYLDILPLYLILLALFPIIYLGIRRFGIAPVLLVSGSIWLVANVDYRVNLPNATADDGWYFNPFAWQFLFAIGSSLAITIERSNGLLLNRIWLSALCWLYVAFAFLQAAPWSIWGLPDLSLLSMKPPDKPHVAAARLVHILALTYLVFSSAKIAALMQRVRLRALEACGRRSLEVFSTGCIAALLGRILFRTFEPTWPIQAAVNGIGITCMIGVALFLDGYWRPETAAKTETDRNPGRTAS